LAASGCIADGEEEEEEKAEEEEEEEEEGRTPLLECAATTARREDVATRGVIALRCCLCEVVIWYRVGVRFVKVKGWLGKKQDGRRHHHAKRHREMRCSICLTKQPLQL